MSIIIQTGHSSSHANKLMQMLYERGLSEPVKSHTHGLSAHNITEKLVKVLNKNESIINTKIVDNLIVDLLLANLDQDDWGWSDENNIHTLPYWQQSDDNVRFVLVFDSPKLLLKQLLGQTITSELVDTAIHAWIAYHEKLLTFFESQSSSCLLIEGDFAIHNLMNVKEHIQAISTNLKLKNNWQVLNNSTKSETDHNPIFEMITDEILKQYPKCSALYKTLIEKSTVRLKNKNLPMHNDLSALIQSLNLFNEQEKFKKKILIENEVLQQKLLALVTEKQSLEQQLSQNVFLLEQSKNSIHAEQQAQIECFEQENKLLTSQLHQVQAELEKYYLQHQKISQDLKTLNQTNEQNKKQVDILITNKSKLESELATLKEIKQQAKLSDHVQQENKLLISQLHQAQEELERYYLENQKLKSENTKAPPKPVYYGAADRVKEDLPYRLGATMVSHSKSAKDLAVLPLALAREYRKFNKKQPNSDLPDIGEYQDAYEAEKVKKHLSYRLGKTLVDGLKSPRNAINLPIKLGKEIAGFNNK